MAEIVHKLRQEHSNFAKLLKILERQIKRYDKDGSINHDMVRDILDYFRGYPVLCHEPKEDLLYRRLRTTADVRALDSVGNLQLEHEDLRSLTDEFEAAIDNLLSDQEAPREKFVNVVQGFVNGYRHHIETEENVLFPVAIQNLSEKDWAEIDREAIDQVDPLFDEKFEKRFEAFLGEILKKSRTEKERR